MLGCKENTKGSEHLGGGKPANGSRNGSVALAPMALTKPSDDSMNTLGTCAMDNPLYQRETSRVFHNALYHQPGARPNEQQLQTFSATADASRGLASSTQPSRARDQTSSGRESASATCSQQQLPASWGAKRIRSGFPASDNNGTARSTKRQRANFKKKAVPSATGTCQAVPEISTVVGSIQTASKSTAKSPFRAPKLAERHLQATNGHANDSAAAPRSGLIASTSGCSPLPC
eukprot:scaffold64552_cov44-Prasinocladus_malaysianus.AAC.2